MRRRRLTVGGAVLGGTGALGVPLGLLWWLLAPRSRVTVGRGGEIVPLPVTEATFAADGYFSLIMMATGLLCGYGVYMLQYRLAAGDRTDLRMACLLGMAAGSGLGSIIAWQLGTLIDAGDFQRAVEAASPGDVIRSGLTLQALSALVAWPFVAVLQYGLFDAVSLWRGDLPAQRIGAEDQDGEDSDSRPDACPAPQAGTWDTDAGTTGDERAPGRPEDSGPRDSP